MEKEVIESNVNRVSSSIIGEVPEDHEIWEEKDGKASIKVTRHRDESFGENELVAMTVSGPSIERNRVITEFTESLGKPAAPTYREPHMDTVVWLVPHNEK